MPRYFPENNLALPQDTEVRSLQKINDILENGVSLSFPTGNATSDLFGRLKVSNPATLGDFTNIDRNSPDFIGTSLGLGSGIGHSVNESSALLSCGTNTGSYAYWESRRVFTYQAGKSLQIMQSFVLNPPIQNLRQRVGYFNTTDGIFLSRAWNSSSSTTETTLNIICTGTSGESVNQSSWNIDPMDGSGPSKINLDWTKTQIMVTEIEWLGVGSVVVSFVVDGKIWPVHQFKHANVFSRTYMKQATLPLRYEIQATTGNLPSVAVLKQICATVISNGGYEKKSSPIIVQSNTVSISSVNVWYPCVAIRLSNLNAVVLPEEVSVLVTSNTGTFEFGLFRNASLASPLSWGSTDSPNVQASIDVPSFTGGTLFRQGFFERSNQGTVVINQPQVYNFSSQLGRNSFIGVSDTVTLAVRAFTTTSTPTIRAALSFFDLTT